MHPPPPSSILNQNLACNWAIFPNLGRTIKSCPFWLKIGAHSTLEVLILNPELDFWNSDCKIYFWAHLGPKIQICSFCLKIGDLVSQGSWFWVQTLGKFGPKLSVLTENWHIWYNEDADSYSNISFLNFQLWIPFKANLDQKSQSCSFCLKVGIHPTSRMLTLISTFVFLSLN